MNKTVKEAAPLPVGLEGSEPEPKITHRCSFCGNSNIVSRYIITGACAVICDECVSECVNIINREKCSPSR